MDRIIGRSPISDRHYRNAFRLTGHPFRLPSVWMVLAAGSAFALLSFGFALANEEMALDYPETRRSDVVDKRFGTAIPDPFRWLEADIRQNADVADWVEAQNEVSTPYLAALPHRATFEERLTALYDAETLTVPRTRGDRAFFQRHSGMDNQAKLVIRERTDGSDRVIVDPNEWSESGTSALGEWAASQDGSHVAFTIHEDGSDRGTIRIIDVDGNALLDDELNWTRFGGIAWLHDGSGFFYGRSPEPAPDAAFEALSVDHAIYFHRLGTPQSEDRVVYSSEAEQPLIHSVNVTEDGTHAVITSTPLNGANSVTAIDLRTDDWTTQPIVPNVEHSWSLTGKVGTKLYLKSDEGSGRGRIVRVDLEAPTPVFEEVVPEHEMAVLLNSAVIGDRLVLSYMHDAKTQVQRFTLDGKPDGDIELPGIGTAGDFQKGSHEDEAFFVFSSFDTPTTIYRHDFVAGESTVWSEPAIASDLDAISVEQRFYASKDGTRIPMFIVRRDDVDAAAPTMLSGYGGFGIPSFPFFSPEVLAWVEQGGVYAIANIRGGGEYGRPWHEAGRRGLKQNVFDDLIAAGEFLKAERITTQDGLAVYGASNGGLLVGAVVNQRPDLFAAALPDVGVLDMLRFDQFTGGPLWAQEYGSPAIEADFRNLLSYSPLHNIQSGMDYPAILVTTADTDDRVVPGHSFKYAAALQAGEHGDRPHLLRVETQAGHGAGKPIDKVIEQTADMWAFAAKWTGLPVRETR